MPTLLKYVIFDGEANQTLLGSIRSISAIQVFNVSITHPNLIASVAPVNVHHHTYGDIFLVELVMIFVGMPCVYGPVKLADVSVQNCKGIISLSDFQLWLAYLWSGADCFLHGVGAAIIRDTQEFLTTLRNDSSAEIKSLDVVDAVYIASNKPPQWGSLRSSQ